MIGIGGGMKELASPNSTPYSQQPQSFTELFHGVSQSFDTEIHGEERASAPKPYTLHPTP